MPMHIRSITIDCHDPYRQAQFWSAATGWLEDPADPNNPGDPESRLSRPESVRNFVGDTRLTAR